jgi:hypothetical protein
MMNESLKADDSDLDTLQVLLSIQAKRVARKLTQSEEAEATQDERLRDRLMRTASIRTIEGNANQSLTEIIRETPQYVDHLVSLVRAISDLERAKLAKQAQSKKGNAGAEELALMLQEHLGFDTIPEEQFNSLPESNNDPFSE